MGIDYRETTVVCGAFRLIMMQNCKHYEKSGDFSMCKHYEDGNCAYK